jgi:hypothetical protein
MKKSMRLIFILSCFLFGAVPPAQAARVYNLSDSAQLIEIKQDGGWKPFIIKPGENYSTIGNSWVRFAGREIYIEHFDEYTIWSQDVISPQRRHQMPGSN